MAGVPGLIPGTKKKKPYVAPAPKGGKPDGRMGGYDPEVGKSAKSQPGQGAPTGGTGRDADGGKERTDFEDERRKQNEGGKDRPPIYKPEDDGERNGYTGRSRTVGAGRAAAFGQVIDKRTVKQKLRDASSRR